MRTKKALLNIISNLILQVITIIYGFVVPKIIIENFGSNVNGLVASITQFLAYIALLESGFGPVVKFVLYKSIAEKNNDKIKRILHTSEKFFRRIAYIFIIYIVILCFLFPTFIKSDFDAFFTISLIVIIAISTFAEYFFGMTYKLFLQAEQKTYVISFIQTITYIVSLIFIVLLVKLGCSIQVIKLTSGIIFVLRPILQNFYVKKKYNISFKEVKEKYEIKQKWDGLAQHIAAVIHGNTDITILTIFSSLSDVSVYSVYYLVTKGLNSLIQSISNGVTSSFGDMIARKEKTNLNNKFKAYELVYFSIITILFSVSATLIIPFVRIYTKNITDANYINITFGLLMILCEFVNMIRLPYISLAYSAGHFKETMKGAWLEAGINIIISILLVNKLGLIGVTIGTFISTLIRAIEFVYHSSKHILNRSLWISIKRIFTASIEFLIMYFICSKTIENYSIENFMDFIIVGVICVFVSGLFVLLINILTSFSDFKIIFNTLKKVFTSKSNNK